jgi:hypothetical protein
VSVTGSFDFPLPDASSLLDPHAAKLTASADVKVMPIARVAIFFMKRPP